MKEEKNKKNLVATATRDITRQHYSCWKLVIFSEKKLATENSNEEK